MRRLLIVIVGLLCLAAADPTPDVPTLTGYVNDTAGVLSAATRDELADTLARYESETTHQIAVLTVKSLHDEPIEAFSLRVANAWRLGRKGRDNGVLLTIAPSERKIRIELGTGMARHVSEAQAQAVIESMTTSFRGGDFDAGVRLGLRQLMEVCRAYRVER